MPRSFLVKKKAEKSKKVPSSSIVSSPGNGYVPDVCQESLQVVQPLTHSQQDDFNKPFTHKVVTTKIWKPETQYNTEKVNSSVVDKAADLNNNYTVSIECDPKDLMQDAENKHKCARCSRTYSTPSGLAKHRQFHCANPYVKKTFNCKFCEKVYFSLGALKMHIRTHTLPCKCKICGKAFSRPWLLQGHIRTHTGEKPYVCSQCNRAFADRSNLRAHLQTHSAVKKYSCTQCSKTFSRMSLLIKHEDAGCPALA